MPLLNETGRFEATVKEAKFGESKTGTPFIEFNFDTEKGSINGWLYLSDAALERTVQVLREVFGFNNDFETLPKQVTGKKCSITTELEDYQGKDLIKVKWINALRSVIPLKDAGALKKFSQMAARIPVEDRAKASKPATKAAPATTGGDEFPSGNPY